MFGRRKKLKACEHLHLLVLRKSPVSATRLSTHEYTDVLFHSFIYTDIDFLSRTSSGASAVSHVQC